MDATFAWSFRSTWTRPSPGRLGPHGEGDYVKENGFGHEDWNFNLNLLIENSLYGYCYYHPNKKIENEKFNIAFGIYSNNKWNLVGFYLEAKFVQNPPISKAILAQKAQDLLGLGDSLGKNWRKKTYLKMKIDAQFLKWQVSPSNTIRTEQPIVIPKKIFNTHNYRIVKPSDRKSVV